MRAGAGRSLAPVFFPGGDAAADVALGLVLIQHLLDLQVQRPVKQRQPLGDILVDGGFADSEFLCRCPDRGPVFYDVQRQALGPLFHVAFQNHNTPISR